MRSFVLIASVFLALATANMATAQKPLKVYILVGQSNMQGHAQTRTFKHLGMDTDTLPMLKKMQRVDGTPTACKDVWITYVSSGGQKQGQLTAGFGADENKIGPEFTFGIYMQEMVDQPILIIKSAWGGKSLHTDFRPPSAGAYPFNETQLEQISKQGRDLEKIQTERREATGVYYRKTMEHVRSILADPRQVYPDYNPELGFELAGFVWFQGWNDMVDRGVYPSRDQPGGYDAYSDVLAHLIRDVRKELKTPNLPFVIGVLGVGGPVSKYLPDQQRYKAVHQNFRDAMAAPTKLSEFNGNVTAVLTENCWDPELTRLRARETKLKNEVKKLITAGKLKQREQKRTLANRLSQEMTDQEIEILQVGISNAEYHYLGSAKIMGKIGQAFAQAIDGLKDSD